MNVLIASDAPNSGELVWQIPSGQTMGEDFRLRIKSVKDPEIQDESDGFVTISMLGIVTPSAGSIYATSGSVSIQWSGLLDLQNTINLSLYKNSVLQSSIVTGTQNDGSYDWTFPGTLANGDDYTVRIVNTATSNTDDSAPFVIVHDLSVAAPNGGEVFVAGANNTITWTPAYAGGVSIQLLDSGTPVATIQSNTSGGSYAWNPPLLTYAGTSFTVRVTTAAAPSKTDDSNATFAILNPPQNVAATDGVYRDRTVLSWNSVTGATSYGIYRADSPGGPYSFVDSTTLTTYIASVLLAEPTVYYFKIRAVRSSVSSLDSAYDAGSRSRFIWSWSFGGTGTGNGQLKRPTDIDVALNSGNPELSTLYVTDSNNYRIQKFTAGGAYAGQWGSYGTGDGQFGGSQGLCVDSSGNRVYVAGGSRIQVFDLNGVFQSWWGRDLVQGTGVHLPGTATSPASGSGDGQFALAWDVAVDSSYVYVVDSDNNRIQKFSKAGVFQGWWGLDSVQGTGWHPPGTAVNPTNGSQTGAFWWPEGITVDLAGNIYIAEPLNGRVQKFTPGGVHLQTITWGSVKKVSFDQDSHIYAVHQSGFGMFNPAGTFQGQFGAAGAGSGLFAVASGICVIPNWAPALANVYVADMNNDIIQVMWRQE
jgi:hypothetical protein